MFLQMSVQIGLLPETAVAQRTPERFLLVVNIANVPLQIRRDGEGAIAVFALVRLFARVSPQMAGQVSRTREDLAAEFARIAVP